ncbi:PD-(D/E)XK nuclease family protein [Pseudoalteromonas denitrificans]|uniref:PD-(D/E)XK nuclease superfamily protein n=1 Tax=Pseudoalteromonas denitrificans DSM 6059 TaxID=1123010 RepID=A0A1I1GDE7_9GAMM|nr:PD-(D/E)XK nuclease family protein [Pseudoalteromonas denitrificans]SFC09486.1 PD-(D/E)XK nuclease superfamily protein [Pseudoalteromonas denitrificans DSM 6059]
MELTKIKALLNKATAYHYDNNRESTLFDIGMRGHFENPTTEVLAFFCNAKAEHGMGALVVDSFLTIIANKTGKTIPYEENSLTPPQREVSTESGKRIDLMFGSDTWLMAIENKIYHTQANPFKEYESFIHQQIKNDSFTQQEPLFVLLSPDGKVTQAEKHKEWCGISYPELVTEIKSRLKDHFYDQPFNKWVIILKDFLLHLENMMTKNKINSEQEKFVFENISGISKTWELLINSFSELDKQFIKQIKGSEEVSADIRVKYQHWFQKLPTFIYSVPNSQIELVLFMINDGASFKKANDTRNENKSIFIQIHIAKKEGGDLHDRVQEEFKGKSVNTWWEKNKLYIRWPAQELTTEGLLKDLTESFIKLNQIEFGSGSYE